MVLNVSFRLYARTSLNDKATTSVTHLFFPVITSLRLLKPFQLYHHTIKMPGIIHVIQVAFQQNADAREIAKVCPSAPYSHQRLLTTALLSQVCEAFGNLKDKCIKPESRVPYIRSLHWGNDVSPENGQVC